MSITLNTIRYFTEGDLYHYTVDNRPLQDLEANDQILKAAIDTVSSNTSILTTSGTWGSILINVDMNQDKNKPFAYRIKLWGVKDISQGAGQSATLSEDIIFGFSDINGNVTISQTNNIFSQSVGTGALAKTFTGSANKFVINFSGYTGTNGYVVAKVERFGI